jgi:hypothetical protein
VQQPDGEGDAEERLSRAWLTQHHEPFAGELLEQLGELRRRPVGVVLQPALEFEPDRAEWDAAPDDGGRVVTDVMTCRRPTQRNSPRVAEPLSAVPDLGLPLPQ